MLYDAQRYKKIEMHGQASFHKAKLVTVNSLDPKGEAAERVLQCCIAHRA